MPKSKDHSPSASSAKIGVVSTLRTPPGFESFHVRLSNQHQPEPETPRHAFFDVPSPVFPPMPNESAVQVFPAAGPSKLNVNPIDDALVAKLQSENRADAAAAKLQFEDSAPNKVKLHNQINELASATDRNEQVKRDSQAKIACLNQQINDLQEAKKHKNHELEEIERRLKTSQLEHESDKMNALMMNKKINKSHKKIKAMEATISDQRDQLANTRAKATQFEQLYRDSEAAVSLLKRQNKDFQRKLDTERIATSQKMEAMEASTRSQSDELASRLTQIRVLKDRNEKLQGQIHDLQYAKKHTQIALDAKNDQLVNTINSLQSERNKFEIQVNILTKVKEVSDGKISLLTAQNIELTKTVEGLNESNLQKDNNMSLAHGNEYDCSQCSESSINHLTFDSSGIDVDDKNTSAVKSESSSQIGELQAQDDTNAPIYLPNNIVTLEFEKENVSTSCSNQAINSKTESIKEQRSEGTKKRSRALKQLESHLQSPKRPRKHVGSSTRRLRERKGRH